MSVTGLANKSNRFTSPTLRATKRQLSLYEKSSLPTTQGRALILPGSPGTEVEELTDVGYLPTRIFGVEHDEEIYHTLLSHYRDTAHMFYDDIFKWMRCAKATNAYSYMHIDLCCNLSRDELVSIQSWKSLVAPTARLRVSSFRGRRSPAQFAWEEQMYEDLLLRWCQVAYDLDTSQPDRWASYHDAFRDSLDDTTRIIVAIILLNFFFGIDDYRLYIDECRQTDSFLPTVDGKHFISSIMRWTYYEVGSVNHMFTVWADLEPMPDDVLRNSPQWILNQLDQVFSSLSHRIPNFNPATMYERKEEGTP